jgi:TRIAD3 protein (E3 ubiquitin-protein ligase RNF216)
MHSYVCSKNVTNYEHFGDATTSGNANRCPLHDNVEARHEEEVKKAAAEALAKVRAEHPHISEAELMIQVSDRVKHAEQTRRGRADVEHIGFPFHMVGNQLVEDPHRQGMAAGLAQPPAHGPMLHPQLRRRVQMPGRPYIPLQPIPPQPVAIQGGPAQYHVPYGVPPPMVPSIPQMPHQPAPPQGNPLGNMYVFNPPPGPGQYPHLPRNRLDPPNRPY